LILRTAKVRKGIMRTTKELGGLYTKIRLLNKEKRVASEGEIKYILAEIERLERDSNSLKIASKEAEKVIGKKRVRYSWKNGLNTQFGLLQWQVLDYQKYTGDKRLSKAFHLA
jgi:hypothetical protein